MGSKLDLWHKAGRIVTAVVVLCFFLPFFGVSCNGMEVVKVSGADMIGGCKPRGMINDVADRMESLGGEGGQGGTMPGVDIEPFAIGALVLALAGFGLAWSRKRQALLAACITAALGVAAMAGLWVTMNGKLNDETDKVMDAERGGLGRGLQSEANIDAGSRFGFWLTTLGFLGIAALTATALREKEHLLPRSDDHHG